MWLGSDVFFYVGVPKNLGFCGVSDGGGGGSWLLVVGLSFSGK